MNRRSLTHAAFVILLFFSGGCNKSASRPDNVLVRIQDETVSISDLALRLVQIPGLKGAPRHTLEEVAHQTLESLIDDKLLYLESKNRAPGISAALVEHEIRQHETLLGPETFSYFTRKNYLSRESLKQRYLEQLSVLEFMKETQLKDKSFCLLGFEVQFPQNCIKRQDFLQKLREKYGVVISRDLSKSALSAILESVI